MGQDMVPNTVPVTDSDMALGTIRDMVLDTESTVQGKELVKVASPAVQYMSLPLI